MAILENISKFEDKPVTLIVNGANLLAIGVVELLLGQGSFVIVVDEYTENKQKLIQSFLDNELFGFVDLSGIESLGRTIPRLDYVYYFSSTTFEKNKVVSTSDFLDTSNKLDKLLQLSIEKKAKFLLVTSLQLNQELHNNKLGIIESDFDDNLNYTSIEKQRYIENLTWEYHKRNGLDARIIRVAKILGDKIDLKEDSILNNFIKSAISGGKIQIPGDGLVKTYFVHYSDAAYGIIKGMFSEGTSGQIFSLYIPRDITVLNLAYKINDLEPRTEGIEFIDEKNEEENQIYTPLNNITSIGWKPRVSFERALAQTIDHAYKIFGGTPKRNSKELTTEGDEKEKSSTKKSILDLIIGFFFEVEEEKKQKSVLENAKYSSPRKKILEGRKSRGRVYVAENKSKKEIQKEKPSIGIITRIKLFFRSLTFPKILLYSIALVILPLFYFALFVPFVDIFYQGFIINKNLNSLDVSISNTEYDKAGSSITSINLALEKTNKDFDKLSYLSKIQIFSDISYLQEKFKEIKELMKGTEIIMNEFLYLDEYREKYRSNILLDDKGKLIVNESVEYDLSGLSGGEDTISYSSKLIDRADINIEQSYFDKTIIGKYLENVNDSLVNIQGAMKELSSFVEFSYYFFGVDESQTYALLLLDDNKLNYNGGEIVSVCVLNIFNGEVSKIMMLEPSDVKLTFSSDQEKKLLSEINLLSIEKDLSFQNLTYISSEESFYSLVKASLSSEFEQDVEHVITMNEEVLVDILKLIEPIEKDKDGNVLTENDLRELFKDEELGEVHLFAHMIERVAGIDNNNFHDLGDLILNNFFEKNLVVYSEDEFFDEYLLGEFQKKDYQDKSYDSIDLSVVSVVKGNLPDISVDTITNIEKEDSMSIFKVSFDGDPENNFRGIISIDLGKNFEILEDTLPEEVNGKIVQEDRIVLDLSLEAGEKSEVILSGKRSSVVLSEGSLYNYNILIKKPLGFFYVYKNTLKYSEDYKLSTYPINTKVNEKGEITWEGSSEKDEYFEFYFDKT